MIATKWTPGPWSIDEYGHVRDALNKPVELSGASLVCGHRPGSDPAFANTRLLAAAPELYEALAAVVDLADKDPFSSVGHMVEHVVPQIREVLAKARGEA